ncbi:hypothetical protein B0H14DRAFT_2642912 [Mycena olivaceomarginata]|nr:hypothetical protein B0H14DRAFT_2642912 [Mycena olivaceomarginata]
MCTEKILGGFQRVIRTPPDHDPVSYGAYCLSLGHVKLLFLPSSRSCFCLLQVRPLTFKLFKSSRVLRLPTPHAQFGSLLIKTFPLRRGSSYLQHQGRLGAHGPLQILVHRSRACFHSYPMLSSTAVVAAPFVYRHDTVRWLTRIREVIACATYHAHTAAHTLNSLAVPASVRDPSATNGPVAGLSTVSGSASSTHDDDDDDE